MGQSGAQFEPTKVCLHSSVLTHSTSVFIFGMLSISQLKNVSTDETSVRVLMTTCAKQVRTPYTSHSPQSNSSLPEGACFMESPILVNNGVAALMTRVSFVYHYKSHLPASTHQEVWKSILSDRRLAFVDGTRYSNPRKVHSICLGRFFTEMQREQSQNPFE